MPTLQDLLESCGTEPGGRLVSSCYLLPPQLEEARIENRLHVTDEGLGFVFLPWHLSTTMDKAREQRILGQPSLPVTGLLSGNS